MNTTQTAIRSHIASMSTEELLAMIEVIEAKGADTDTDDMVILTLACVAVETRHDLVNDEVDGILYADGFTGTYRDALAEALAA